MLGRLGLDLRGAYRGDERQVHVGHRVAAKFHAHLADRLEKRQRLDVTDGAADLHHADVGVAGPQLDAAFDLVGDVRDHLHGRAEVIAPALLGDHALVDPAGGEIAVATGRRADKPLVVPEVQVRLGAVIGHEHLAVLERTHRARIDVDVRVQLDHRHAQPARLEDCTQRGGGNALPQRGNHATSDENVSGHEENTAAAEERRTA
jgi:hypothetical protein